jgi:hypothetical protein
MLGSFAVSMVLAPPRSRSPRGSRNGKNLNEMIASHSCLRAQESASALLGMTFSVAAPTLSGNVSMKKTKPASVCVTFRVVLIQSMCLR